MRRHLLGLLGLTLVALGMPAAFGWIETSESRGPLFAALFRLGLELGVLWLAWPDLVRLTPRLATGLIAVALMLLVLPRQMLVVGALVFAAWLLARRWFATPIPPRS